MTRKQALTLAIRALSTSPQQEEAVQILHTLREELPLDRWSDAAIRDAVEQFILDRGRVPTVTDFKKRGLPPHTVIRNKYGVTLRDWLQENYPAEPGTAGEVKAAATALFVREYLRIQPKSAKEFDKKRSPECNCWYTIAGYHHTGSWRALLSMLELPVYHHSAVPEEKREYYVQFDAELDEMEPFSKEVLTKMVMEHHRAFPAPNFRIARVSDEKDPSIEHFILRFVTDKRLAYEARKAAGAESL